MLRNFKVIKTALIILTIIAVGFVLIIGRDFIYPVCMAVIFAYLVYPLTRFLENILKNRVLATLISVLMLVIVFLGSIFLLYKQFSFFLNDFDTLRQQAIINMNLLGEKLHNLMPFWFDSTHTLDGYINEALGAQQNLLNQVFNSTTGTLLGIGIQPVYIYFMLYYRHQFRAFLFDIIDSQNHNILSLILKDVALVTKNYVSGVFIVVVILCCLNTFGLMIIGVEYALLFGVISAIMNFIPYFGTLIGAAIPLAYTLVSSEPENAIGVIILFIIIQFLENNILTPNITGGRVAINPLFTIFIIIIGGMMWGLPGMFVFVPLLGMFKVICGHVPFLQPWAKVIAPKHPNRLSPLIKWVENNLRK